MTGRTAMAANTCGTLLEDFSKLQFVITIRLLRAELADDIDAAAHAWWIQHHYRISAPVLGALWSEARQAADGYRLAGDEAVPDQAVELQLLLCEFTLDSVRRQRRIGRADGFMRLLG